MHPHPHVRAFAVVSLIAIVAGAQSSPATSAVKDPLDACIAGEVGSVRACAMPLIQSRCTRPADAIPCRDEINRRVAAYSSALGSCVDALKLSPCLAIENLHDRSQCLQQCVKQAADRANSVEQAEEARCIQAFVDAKGHALTTCRLAQAQEPVPSMPSSDEAMSAARAKDGPKLDELGARIDVVMSSEAQKSCSKRCADRAPNALQAAAQADRLVSSYKRCMVSADSTHEARKLNAYETDLYCDLLHKADVQCRSSSRCDWLEEYSDARCVYVSPGTGVCAE